MKYAGLIYAALVVCLILVPPWSAEHECDPDILHAGDVEQIPTLYAMYVDIVERSGIVEYRGNRQGIGSHLIWSRPKTREVESRGFRYDENYGSEGYVEVDLVALSYRIILVSIVSLGIVSLLGMRGQGNRKSRRKV